jgi:hypothetical protein
VFDGHRRDVVVDGDRALRAAAAGRDTHAGHRAALVDHLPDLRAEHELDAEGAQIPLPGVDPGLAGRGIEDAVDVGVAVHAPAGQAPQQQGLDGDAADHGGT